MRIVFVEIYRLKWTPKKVVFTFLGVLFYFVKNFLKKRYSRKGYELFGLKLGDGKGIDM